MERLYAPSNRAEHPQHPIQLLLFVSSLGVDRKPQSAEGRFIDSSNRGLHKFPASSFQCRQRMIDSEDVSSVARQLAELTRTVEEMQSQLDKFRLGAETQQERADTQQERIDLAARELAEVSNRLQAAARALRQSI
jgi:hypothetical protein